ncbi:MAG: chromophore lyase CpcT/CpeT [Sphingomonadaceae bacterium]
MMRFFKLRPTAPLLLLLVQPAAAALAQPAAALPAPLLDYAETVTGRFTSAAQAAADPRYDRVDAHVVRLWPERTDALWLYQEQTIAGAPRPYFQRVARVVLQPDGTVFRDNHALKAPERFAGFGLPGYTGPAITPDDLGPAGCPTLHDQAGPGAWTGRTTECPSSHRGAAYMVSRAILLRDRLWNWDRGFDTTGRQVWGPEAGGYVFDRVE